jgi:hypothetical protein
MIEFIVEGGILRKPLIYLHQCGCFLPESLGEGKSYLEQIERRRCFGYLFYLRKAGVFGGEEKLWAGCFV